MAGFSFSALAPKLLSVARSTAAGGLAGGIALVLVMVAQAYNFPLTETQAGAIVGGIVWVVVHLTPDSLKDHVASLASKLNVSSADVATQLLVLVPQAVPQFPGNDGSQPTNVSNIVRTQATLATIQNTEPR